MERHFDCVTKYAKSRDFDPIPILSTLYRYTVLFDNCNCCTIYYFNKTHMKLFLYLIDKYFEDKNDVVSDDDLNILFFMVLVHVVEDYMIISTNILGDGMNTKFLTINDEMYPYIFRANLDNNILEKFWENVKQFKQNKQLLIKG